MKLCIILSLSLLVSFSVLSVRAGDFILVSSGEFDGKSYDFRVSTEALSNAPQWKDGDPFPPLPPLKAREIAVKKAKELCPFVKRWKGDKITLEHIYYKDLNKPIFWVYVIRCEEQEDGLMTGLPGYLDIPVMLNGIAVEPLINP